MNSQERIKNFNNTFYIIFTGDVKYAPLISDARNTMKYKTFCVVTLQALRKDGAFIFCHSAMIHIISCIRHTSANVKNMVANAM